jgi:hypothetical protein
MSQPTNVTTTTRAPATTTPAAPSPQAGTLPYLHFATRLEIREAVAAGEMTDREAHELMGSYALPTRPMPVAGRIGTGFVPAIYHPERTAEWLRFERFPRKAKATGAEAVAYATKVLAWREHFAAYKRQRREATAHPRWLRYFSQAAE